MTEDFGKKSARAERISRRQFMFLASNLGFGALAAGPITTWLSPAHALGLDNPLEKHADRDWEKVYRDLFRYDSSFTFLCAPNDTHNCILRAFVKNGVIVRIEPSYGYGKATDLYGNRASGRWDPRCCQKGLGLVRRFYSDRRIRGPMVRKGFKTWVDKGFPRGADGRPPTELFRRGQDSFIKVTWDEAFEIAAKTHFNIAKTYTGESGAKLLHAQGYDEEMIEGMHGAGVRAMKFRGGMPLLGQTRVFALNRYGNSMALLDAKIRGVAPDQATGATNWDSYTWHTDLPPGHPMVSGQQTFEWDLFSTEHAKLVVLWGMNWISTKMPDSHWLTEARIKGTKVFVVACEYQSSTCKADEALVVRPGTSPALALGLAHVIISNKLYDKEFVQTRTDLPMLVRMDTRQMLRAADVFEGHKNAALTNFAGVLKPGEKAPPPGRQGQQVIPEAMREEWGDFVYWDETKKSPGAVSRNEIGKGFSKPAAIEGEYEITLKDGTKVKTAPVFEIIKRHIAENYDLDTISEITWAPKEGIESLARLIAESRGTALIACGMGPNQFFNNDLKDRAILLVGALTGNVGGIAGNVGSYAGNYRTALFNGVPNYILENPFDLELDVAKAPRVKKYLKYESAHYFNYGDRPLKAGKHNLTGKTQMPVPTKSAWWANGNSILGNTKWHYDVITNTLPKVEAVFVNDWSWTATCEYADIVFGVDSWAEFKFPDMCASVTNPFLTVYPVTPLQRIVDTRSDIEVVAGVARALGKITGEKRFEDCWKFVHEGRVEVYLQRILDGSSCARGYVFDEIHERAKDGIPAMMLNRTYPRTVGWEQAVEDKPYYTKTGRLEFYREEPEFINNGENLPLYREPIDSTFYEPNVIVSKGDNAIHPKTPADYGLSPNDLSTEVRQVRNVIKPWSQVRETQHPLMKDGYRFVYHTPKYRHGAHTTPVDTDIVAVLFGPFGDWYRRDKRQPAVTEGYIDINPADAKALGINDGDYVWVDADPQDRPYRGWKKGDAAYKIARLMCRARYYNGTPSGVTRSWYNMYGATYGSVKGHETRPDGLAKNPETNYQAMFRYGSHQSGSRAWIKPTLVTDTLVRKDTFGQAINKGFEPDIHCPTGAPRESFVKITKAEPGGNGGKGIWRPATLGLRPTYESDAMKKFLAGDYIKDEG